MTEIPTPATASSRGAEDDEGPIADLARDVASWAHGDVHIAVYRAAKNVLAKALASRDKRIAELEQAVADFAANAESGWGAAGEELQRAEAAEARIATLTEALAAKSPATTGGPTRSGWGIRLRDQWPDALRQLAVDLEAAREMLNSQDRQLNARATDAAMSELAGAQQVADFFMWWRDHRSEFNPETELREFRQIRFHIEKQEKEIARLNAALNSSGERTSTPEEGGKS